MSNHEPGTIIEVAAGHHDRENVIVSFPCAGDCGCGGSHALIELEPDGTPGTAVLCQCVSDCSCEGDCEGDCGELVWIIPSLKAGETRRYQIGPAAEGSCGCGCGCAESAPGGVSINLIEGDRADILIGGELFTSYVVKEGIARPYCWPVFGPGGAYMTNLGPSDHIHHKSMYVAQGDVNGHDNWSEMEKHASTVNRNLVVLAEGPVFGEILSISDWVTAKGELLLQEITKVRVYNLPDTARLMDWDITWYAAYQGVFLGDTKEAGTLAVRVAESMEVDNGGTIRNSYGGINDAECWGKRAQWVDYYGPVSTGIAGITLMDHPENLRHPTYWHVRDYGLFTANQWGVHDFTGDHSQRGDLALEAGDALNFLFRAYIHAGDTDQAAVGARYLDFIYPPKVTVVS